MIKAVFCDIDGCLNSGKFSPLDLATLEKIKQQINRMERLGCTFFLSSGRPQPYVEGIAQALDVQTLQLFENGAGIFDPAHGVVPQLSQGQVPIDFSDLKRQIKAHPKFDPAMYFETGKEFSISLSGLPIANMSNPDRAAFTHMLAQAFGSIPAQWTFSSTAIDITEQGVSKRSSCAFVLNSLGLVASEVAAVGDSDGDLEVLKYVGHPFAPANATESVQAVAKFQSSDPFAKGTSQILAHIIQQIEGADRDA